MKKAMLYSMPLIRTDKNTCLVSASSHVAVCVRIWLEVMISESLRIDLTTIRPAAELRKCQEENGSLTFYNDTPE